MHSKNREPNTKWLRALATSGLALAALALAGAAEAGDRRHRPHRDHGAHADARHRGVDRASVREARRYDRRLDQRGNAIDLQLDLLAMVAAAHGEYALAEHLDRKGDRIERRLDRKGDRALRRARKDLHRGHDRDRKWSERDRRFEKKHRLDGKRARKVERERTRSRDHERDRERRISRKADRRDDRSHVDALAIRALGRMR